jgi:hypothetical protein
MTMGRWTYASTALAALGVACVVAGCAGSKRGSLEGRVTFDGQPVDDGSIRLVPAGDTKAPVVGAVITDGEYVIEAEKGPVPGRYRVEIRSPRPTGKRVPVAPPAPPGAMMDEMKEAIPADYNTNSTLVIEIVAGKNQRDFDVPGGGASKPR